MKHPHADKSQLDLGALEAWLERHEKDMLALLETLVNIDSGSCLLYTSPSPRD